MVSITVISWLNEGAPQCCRSIVTTQVIYWCCTSYTGYL